MSGIVGILHLLRSPVDVPVLENLTEFLIFRGPDAKAIWTEDGDAGYVGFGHTLLKTSKEVERKSQPLTLDGQVWIVADARVDGRFDLRSKLQSHGHPDLKDASDAELILRSYYVWDERCVDHLLGDVLCAYTEVFDWLIPHEERHYAGLVAKALGIPIRYRTGDDCKLYDIFDDPGFRWPEPAHSPWGTSSMIQLREIAARRRVVLTGLGADPGLSSSLTSHFRTLFRKKRFGSALADAAQYLMAQGRFSRLYLHTRWLLLFKAKGKRPWFPRWLNGDLEKRFTNTDNRLSAVLRRRRFRGADAPLLDGSFVATLARVAFFHPAQR